MRITIDQSLYLQTLTVENAEELTNLINKDRAYLSKWLTWVKNSVTIKDNLKIIHSSIENEKQKKGYEFGIFLNDQITGTIWLNPIDYVNAKSTIGYWLGEEFQGKGIMTKTCKAIVAFAFEQVKLNRIELIVATENVRSRRLAERIGFVLEGILRENECIDGKITDDAVYSLLKKEWQQ